MPQIYIRTRLVYEGPANESHMRVFFPHDQILGIDANTFMHVSNGENTLKIAIQSAFTEQTSVRRFAAFQTVLDQGKHINILNPEDGKIEAFIKDNIGKWVEPGNRIFGLIRWSYNSGLADFRAAHEIEWSLDNQAFHRFNTIDITPAKPTWLVVPVNSIKFCVDATNPNLREPDYHRFLRDAQSFLADNPKSALLMLVVALEIGMKRFLTYKNSELEKIFNGAGPPSLETIFTTMLREVEPALEFNNDSVELFRTLVLNRNELVHRGIFNLSTESLLKRYELVSDILYILDYYQGVSWFNQSFYEFHPRLEHDHKVEHRSAVNIGEINPGSYQRVVFKKRFWDNYT